jgi:hypothetical protein
MKNILIFIFFLLALVLAQYTKGQSVDDIINQYIAARGGRDHLTSIKSIYLEGTREFMGNEVQLKETRVDGKLYRVDFALGNNTGYSIITPDKGWTYFPMRSTQAVEIPADRLKMLQGQLDIAGPLVDYQEKGYKATLLGQDTVNGKEAWMIHLTDSLGKDLTFYIDTTSHLLVKKIQVVASRGRRDNEEPREIITDYGDYKDFGGVLFAQTITTEGSGMGAGAMYFDTIKLNQPVDEKLYKPDH